MVVRPMIEIKLNYIRDELFAFIINIPTGICNSGWMQLRQFMNEVTRSPYVYSIPMIFVYSIAVH